MVEIHRARKVVVSLRKLTGIAESDPRKQVMGIRKRLKEIEPSRIEKETERMKERHGIRESFYNRIINSMSENPPTKTKRMLYHLYSAKGKITTRQLYDKMGLKEANELVNLFDEIRLIQRIEQGNSFKLKPALITGIDKKTIKKLYPDVENWEEIEKPVIKRGEYKWCGIDTMKTGIEIFGLGVESHYQLRGKHLPKLVMEKEHREQLKRKGVRREKTLNSLRQRAMEGELLERAGKPVPPGKIYLTDKQVEKIKEIELEDLPKKWMVTEKELENAKKSILKRREKRIPTEKRIPKKAKLILKILETDLNGIKAEHIPKLENINKKGLDRKELIRRNIAVGNTDIGNNAEILMKTAIENEILHRIGKTSETITSKDLEKIEQIDYEDIMPEKSGFGKAKFQNIKQKLIDKTRKNA